MHSMVAVTGASGHIGNVVCRVLLQQGYQVKAQYMSSKESLEGLPLSIHAGDILNPGDLDELMQGCDAVIHCAGRISIHGDPDGSVFKTNTVGTRNVVDAAKRNKLKKIIHISSVHAVEELPHNTPFDEHRPYKTAEATSYEYSKALSEKQVLEAGNNGTLEVVVIRPGSVLGPFDFKPSEMGKALMEFYNGKIPALPEGGYDFADVRDVAKSIVSALEKGRKQQVYLVTGKYHTMRQFVRVINQVTGKKVPHAVIPYGILRLSLPFISLYSKITGAPPLFTRQSIDVLKDGHPKMNHDKAVNELGHSTRPMEETLRDFYAWKKGAHVPL